MVRCQDPSLYRFCTVYLAKNGISLKTTKKDLKNGRPLDVDNFTGKRVKVLRTQNDGEHISKIPKDQSNLVGIGMS